MLPAYLIHVPCNITHKLLCTAAQYRVYMYARWGVTFRVTFDFGVGNFSLICVLPALFISHPLFCTAVLYCSTAYPVPTCSWECKPIRSQHAKSSTIPNTLYTFKELFQAKYVRCPAALEMGRGEKQLFFFRLYNFKNSIY